MKDSYNQNFIEGETLTQLITQLWQDEEELGKIYVKAQKDCEKFLKAIKIN